MTDPSVNPMIERVAKAMFDKGEKWMSKGGPFWETAPELQKRTLLLLQARAAIEAMREPTEKMKAAGQWAQLDTVNPPVARCVEANLLGAKVFQAYIDAALAD